MPARILVIEDPPANTAPIAAGPRHAGTPARRSAWLIGRKARQRTKSKMRLDSMAGSGRIVGTGPQVPAYQGET